MPHPKQRASTIEIYETVGIHVSFIRYFAGYKVQRSMTDLHRFHDPSQLLIVMIEMLMNLILNYMMLSYYIKILIIANLPQPLKTNTK